MKPISRRAFLAGSASVVATPALAGTRQAPGMLDAIIVGAGAAGIAAGRRLAAANKHFLIVEATDRIGGRCFTETQTFGVRRHVAQRSKLRREAVTVQTPWGPVQGKRGWRGGLSVFTPEYEDCARIAREQEVPLREVFEAVRRAN